MMYFISPYVKKSDLPKYLNSLKLFKLLALIFFSITLLVIYLLIFNSVNGMLLQFSRSDLINQNFTYLFYFICATQIVLAIISYTLNPGIEKINALVGNKPEKERINVGKFVNIKFELIAFVLAAVQVYIIIQNLIIPLYSLADSF